MLSQNFKSTSGYANDKKRIFPINQGLNEFWSESGIAYNDDDVI